MSLLAKLAFTGARAVVSLAGSAPVHTSTTSLTTACAFPSAAAVGDLLVILLEASKAVTYTTPSGWTASTAGGGAGGNSGGMGSFYKIATSADITAGSVSITSNLSITASGEVLAFRGAAWDTAGAVGSGSANVLTCPAITVADRSTLVMVGGYIATSTAMSTPTGMTLVDTVQLSPTQGVWTQANMTAGSTGTRVSTRTGGGASVSNLDGFLFSVKPA